MMTYARFYNWVVHKGPDVIKYYAIPLLADGKTLCTSGIGTGINENNKYFGNATWGNCKGKIKVRDE